MHNHWEVLRFDKIVSSTAEGLWEDAIAYFKWCEDHPIINKITIKTGKDTGKKVTEELTRPYNLKALCIHCGIDEDYIRTVRSTIDKKDMYYIVLSKILYIIYIQNLELATVGVFNPIFTAKMLGMDKEEAPSGSVKIEFVGGLPELSNSENEVLEKLEAEGDLFKMVGAEKPHFRN